MLVRSFGVIAAVTALFFACKSEDAQHSPAPTRSFDAGAQPACTPADPGDLCDDICESQVAVCEFGYWHCKPSGQSKCDAGETYPKPPLATGGPCEVKEVRGDLPGVILGIAGDGCTVREGDGADFRYTVTIEDGAPAMVLNDQGGCGSCGNFSSDPLSFTQPTVEGENVRFCNCDRGCCAPQNGTFTLNRGTASATFRWPGRAWNGSSDTSNPLGAPFPPGDYEVKLSFGDASGKSVVAALPIHVIAK